jgi:hypothetical protein
MTRLTRALVALALALPVAAQAQVSLQRKNVEGKTLIKNALKINQTLTVAGQEVKTEVSLDEAVSHDVGKAAADGSRKVVRQGDSLVVTLNAPGLEAKFDSKNPAAAKSDLPQVQAMLEMWGALAKGSFTTVVDKSGQVIAVEGIDKLTAGLSPAAADLIRSELSLEQIKREATQDLKAQPDGPVKKGDKWQRAETMSLGAGQTFTFDTHYEYVGPVEQGGRKLEKVNIFLAGVTYKQEGDGLGGAKVTGSDLKVTASMGYYLFDPENGLVVERYGNTTVQGTLMLDINGMALPAMLNLTLDLLVNTRRP